MNNNTFKNIPKEVLHITNKLKNAEFEAYLVGGCVRDLLLDKKPKDWDITTNAKPEEIMSLFEHTHYENDFGTVGVVNDETENERVEVVEVTPYRIESEYTDKRRPDSVSFGKKIEEDLERRDFTVNAIAIDPENGEVVDPFGGQKDLKDKVLRAVGEPGERFEEDGLRIIRAVRLQAELGFAIEAETLNAINKKRKILEFVAKERIRDEFKRIIMSKNPAEALEISKRLEILEYIVPELLECVGIEQTKTHKYDVYNHLLKTLQHSADKDWEFHVRLSCLFHDIGKPKTRKWAKKGDYSFYGHDVVGAKIAEKSLSNLSFSKDIIKKVSLLVRWHMFFSDTEQITLSAVRRILRNVGKDLIQDLIKVRIADRVGTGRPKEQPYRLRKYQSMIDEVMSDPVSVGMLKIDGNDIIKELNIKPGPKMGLLLHALLEEVLEDPKLNTKKYLLNKCKELAQLNEKELEKLGDKGKEAKNKAENDKLGEIRKKHHVK